LEEHDSLLLSRRTAANTLTQVDVIGFDFDENVEKNGKPKKVNFPIKIIN